MWRIKEGLIPGYVAVLVTTPFFIDLIQLHRVGAVKQRLYVDNLLEIRIPHLSEEEQRQIADARELALNSIDIAKKRIATTAAEVEALILGTSKLKIADEVF